MKFNSCLQDFFSILSMYLGAPYTFNKIGYYLSKKKLGNLIGEYYK